MKVYSLTLSAVLICLPSHRAEADTTSCTSTYCSTSITCPGPAWAACDITCSSGCSPRAPDPGASASPPSQTSGPLLDLDINSLSASHVAEILSQQLQATVFFLSNEPLSISAKAMPAEEFLQALGHHGAVLIRHGLQGVPLDSRASLSLPHSLFARGVTDGQLSEALTQAVGRPVRFRAGGTEPLSLEIKNLPLATLLEALASHGSVEFPSSREQLD